MYRLPFKIWKRSLCSLHRGEAAASTIACGTSNCQCLGKRWTIPTSILYVDVEVVMRKCVQGSRGLKKGFRNPERGFRSRGLGFPPDWVEDAKLH